MRQSQPALPFEPDTPDAQPGGADEPVDVGERPERRKRVPPPPDPGEEGQDFY